MVRDEADVIEGVLRHLDGEALNGIVVADNLSSDGTGDLLRDLAGDLATPLVVVDDPEPGYFQSEKMTRLAALAADRDAGDTWIVPFDADELWVAPDRIGHMLRATPADHNLHPAPITDHVPTAVDPPEPDPFRRIQFRRPGPGHPRHWKVAFKWQPGAVIAQGNHSATLPQGECAVPDPALEIRHFPYRTYEQFRRKVRNGAAAYAAANNPRADVGLHWVTWGKLDDPQLREVWTRYRCSLSPTDDGLILDPAPYRRWETIESLLRGCR